MLIRLLETRKPGEIQALVALALAQEARQEANAPGLLTTHTAAQIEARLRESTRLLVAVDASGRLRGSAQPAVWKLERESVLRAFVSSNNGIASRLIIPDPQDEDSPEVIETLLAALSAFWTRQDTYADLVRWPSLDTWLLPLVAKHRFQLDSICAFRSFDPFLGEIPLIPAGLHLRLAQPADEVALIRLFQEELLFHERFTPFVRCSPAVLQAFQRKLERLWAGVSFEDGAPLIVVAQQGTDLVAMAENTLVTLEEKDEPGFTPPGTYWCIDNVSVLPALHRQGIGRALLYTLESLRSALKIEPRGYLLWYNPDNPSAARFWQRLGFTPMWTTYQRRKVWEKPEDLPDF